MEKDDKNDSSTIPPRDDVGEDEVVDDVVDDDDDEDQGSIDQGEPSLRRLAHVLVLSSKYPSSEYVQVNKSGESLTFSEVKAHVIGWIGQGLYKMR